MSSASTQPERTYSLSQLDLDSLSFSDDIATQSQTPTTPRYAVFSWADALAAQYHGWDPRVYSDPLPSTSTAPPAFHDDQYLDATFPPLPPIDSDGCPGTSASVPLGGHDAAEELQPGTHSSSSVLLHHPFPYHHQNTGSWFASRGGTPVGNHSYDVEFYSSAPSSPRSPDADVTGPSGHHRTRPAIALDPTQPLRVDGKPRERVSAACERCRVRKLRCDGAQPTCYNCQRAAEKGDVRCAYPSGPPKRRGADKTQRIRSPIGQRRPRKAVVPAGRKRKERAESESATDASSSVPGTPDDIDD